MDGNVLLTKIHRQPWAKCSEEFRPMWQFPSLLKKVSEEVESSMP